MSVVSHRLRAVFFDLPKAGSTALKHVLWKLEHGAPFDGTGLRRIGHALRWKLAARGLATPRTIHEMAGYRNLAFGIAEVPDGYDRVAILRDPASRFRSAWRDKVHRAQFAWRGETMDVENAGLPLDPSFGEFVDNWETYRLLSRPARVHTMPYEWHLGPDLDVYDRVFRLEDIAELQAYLSQRAGEAVTLGRENASAPDDTRPDALSPRQIDRLFEILEPDYALAGARYDAQAARARFG